MTLSDIKLSPGLAKELKSLGMPQNAIHAYCGDNLDCILQKSNTSASYKLASRGGEVDAPTAEEILEYMPISIEINGKSHELLITKTEDAYNVGYYEVTEDVVTVAISVDKKKLVDAAGKLLIVIAKEGYVTFTK
jgi:hypothetical protein